MTPDQDARQSAHQNAQMFDRIARRYDLLNRLLSLGLDSRWRAAAVDELAPRAGQRVLDVGCGTADLCIEIARRAAGIEVCGVDLSAGMIERGRQKVRRAGLDAAITLTLGNAQALDEFPAASFDRIVSGFCYRNLTDRPAGLREMLRLLRPEGKVVILELTTPACPVVRPLHRLYNRTVVPLLGRMLSRGEAYRYLVRSIEDFPSPAETLELMAQAGLSNCRHRPLSKGIVGLFIADAADDK